MRAKLATIKGKSNMAMPLHMKYRPTSFDGVIGQAAAVKALRNSIARKSARTFLLSGPSGTGKTTLARIAASELGAARVVDFNAAKQTGVDDVRGLEDALRYKPFGGGGRAIIMDECHRLSRNAWDALLKPIEEPPAWLSWFLCTTEPSKLPRTIITRCAPVPLKPVRDDALASLMDEVCEAESIKVSEDVAGLIIREAGGSPRQLLVNLEACRDAKNKRAAAELLKTIGSDKDSDAVIALARHITNGGASWRALMAIVATLPPNTAEGTRIIIANYLAKALQGATSDDAAAALLGKLDAFSTPYTQSEGNAQLMLSIGRSLFAD